MGRSTIRVVSRYRESTLTQSFSLDSARKEIRVSVAVDWRERFKCLKLEFPVAAERPTARYEIPFGEIERPADGCEQPMQNWVDVSDAGGGVALVNTYKYGADVTGSLLRLTVLRSPAYAYHQPYRLGGDGDGYAVIDQGIQEFRYVLLPHRGSLKASALVRRGLELNQPLAAVTESFHSGSLAETGSFVRIGGENIVLSALKEAEDGEGYVLRAYETDGNETDATIELPAAARTIRTRFGPHEIKTFLIPFAPEKEVSACNLLEL